MDKMFSILERLEKYITQERSDMEKQIKKMDKQLDHMEKMIDEEQKYRVSIFKRGEKIAEELIKQSNLASYNGKEAKKWKTLYQSYINEDQQNA